MGKLNYKELALDTNVLNWLAFQGTQNEVQRHSEKRQDYDAIKRLFALQEKCCITLAGPDQVYREAMETKDEEKKRNSCTHGTVASGSITSPASLSILRMGRTS